MRAVIKLVDRVNGELTEKYVAKANLDQDCLVSFATGSKENAQSFDLKSDQSLIQEVMNAAINHDSFGTDDAHYVGVELVAA